MQLDHALGRIYYDVTTVAGTLPVVYVHSALGSSGELAALRERFSDRTSIAIDLPAHGSSTVSEANARGEITTESLGELLAALLDHLRIERADLIGYSLGGYAALEFATRHGWRVRSVVSHAMKYYWTPEAIERSTAALSREVMRNGSPRYLAALENVHAAAGWQRAAETVRALMLDFHRRQLEVESIVKSQTPVLLTLGDSDELIPLTELESLYNAIGHAQCALSILPNTRHAIRTLPAERFEHVVRSFWSGLTEI